MLKFLFVLFFCVVFLLVAEAQELIELESKKETSIGGFEFEFSKLSVGIQGSLFKPENETKLIGGEEIIYTPSMFMGQGLELGYKYTDDLAFRFSIRDLPFESETIAGEKDNKLMTSLEVINNFAEFPVYFVSGINYLNDDKSKLSINFGPGIRFDFNKHFHSYVESKMNFSLGGGSSSFSINLGLVYRFGKQSAKIIRTDEDIIPTKEMLAAAEYAKALAQDELVAMSQSTTITKQATLPDMAIAVDPFRICQSQQELLEGNEQFIYFQQDDVKLTLDNTKHINCLANTLMEHLNARLYIDGYVSASDSADDGLLLAYRRALIVKEYLLTIYGINENRLIVVRHSDVADFVITEQTDTSQGNRRVGYHIELID